MAQILVGTNDLQSGGTRYTPKKFIIHEEYDRPRFANNIALLLVEKIEFNDRVQPVKYSKKFVESGERILVTGWGSLSVSSLEKLL